jgi:hypothetical protein
MRVWRTSMRCSKATRILSTLAAPEELKRRPAFAAHVEACPVCRTALEDHLRLLELLADPPPLPVFSDVTGRVLERIDRPVLANRWVWRWAAAAVLAIAGLVLGYRLGVGISGTADASRPIVSTYREALYGLPSDSTEMAYMDTATGPQPVTERSLP